MNKNLLLLAAMALAVPALPVAALDGSGTAEDPYRIATVDDLKAIATIDQTDYSYYKLMNDIDMGGQTWKPLFVEVASAKFKYGRIHFDGNGHVISNMTYTGSYASLFGQLDGSVKNLGLTDFEFNGPGAYDPSGSLAAYAGFDEVFTAEGCFAIGTVSGFYAGGLIGGTKHGASFKNCYTSVNVSSANGFAGGLCAAINYDNTGGGYVNVVDVENCFVDGNVTSASFAGGLVGANQNYAHPAAGSEVLNIVNAVVFSQSITGPSADAVAFAKATPNLIVNAENVMVFDEVKVNNEPVADGVSYDDALAEVLSWPAFTMNDDGDLCLKWEVEGISGISDIVVDEAVNGPAEYYNLQGVRVANPESGVYIVRCGSKAFKALVK